MQPVDYVPLQYSVTAGRAALREISGNEEWMVQRADTLAAVQLLDHLLLEIPGTDCKPGQASQLSAADRDRMLAAIYRRMYGETVATTLTCRQCHQDFDLDFELDELETTFSAKPPPPEIQKVGDTFQLSDGIRFRLPTGSDELAVSGLPSDQARSELLRRCLPNGDQGQTEKVLAAMQTVAPLLEGDLQAACPDCGFTQTLHFDLQRYLLITIQDANGQLVYQVHLLASAYGWSLDSILDLPRSRRLALVKLIENQPQEESAGEAV